MEVSNEELWDYQQTGDKIWWNIKNYSGDIAGLKDMPLDEYYELIQDIPYLLDGDYYYFPQETSQEEEIWEVTARPKRIFELLLGIGIDCKKKAILIGSWLEQNGLEHRILAVSEIATQEPHHVFNQVKLGGRWLNIDATTRQYELFETKPQVTYAEEL